MRTVRDIGLHTDTEWKDLERSLLKMKPKKDK